MCPNWQQPVALAIAQRPVTRNLWCAVVFAFLSLLMVAGPWVQNANAQEDRDAGENIREPGVDVEPTLQRLVTPPMVEESALDDRWSDFRASWNGPDEDRAFESFMTIAQELGYTRLPVHASALHREARLAMQAGDFATVDRRIAQAARLSPSGPQIPWAEAERALASEPWAAHVWLRATLSALQREWRTPGGHHALTNWFIALGHRAGLVLFLSGLLLMTLKYTSRMAFDVRLLLGRLPTWRQMHVVLLLGFGYAALTAPLWVTGTLMGFSLCLWAGRRDVPLVVATAMASVVVFSPVKGPEYDINLAEWIAAAPSSPCPERCVEALERASSEGLDAARVALAWTHYRRGNTASLTRAQELLDSAQCAGEPAAWQSLLRGHLSVIAGEFSLAEQHYREAAEHSRDRETHATITVSLSRVAMATDDTETARQLVLAAAEAGHPLLDQWTRYEGRSQNALLPGWHMSTRGLLKHLQDEGFATGARWDGLVEWGSLGVAASFLVGLLLALLLHRSGIRSEACITCGTPTSRFVLAAAHRDHQCVWCYQATDRSVMLSFEDQQTREGRAETRVTRMKWLNWLTLCFAPGASLWLRFAPLSGAIVWLMSTVALSLALTDDRSLLVLGDGSPVWSVLRPVWGSYILLALSILGGAIVTYRAHDDGGAA